MRTDLAPDLAALEERLLTLGGEVLGGGASWLRMELQEEFVQALLERAQPMSGDDARIVRGYAISCHDNAAALAERFASYEHYSGVALTEADGMWRVHSWCVTPSGVVETTEPRLIYFGLPASEDPSLDPLW